ncbi:SDR family oxidoreductase [Massilia litorea]|uniref:SDR family oxidoreductase n=1 Tax=Massilia litorea TaxID=2769491 RepID=A0A7L9U2D9_9BURK|nr:SDR family oxidoreductase [Massilia litorea]QOL48365.1 SDR family oxidoreductase [Massilia litorea]
MKLKDATVFITGANRGLGLAFARHALAAGARKVYGAARDPASVTLPGLVPVALDVSNPSQVAAAAADCGNVTLVVNNAGIADFGGLLGEDSIASTARMMETNVYGLLRVSGAFAPVLKANGGGALLNVLSVASWLSAPALAAYAVSKAAAWSATNGLRNELRAQGTQVLGLHVGFIDTDLTRGIDAPKLAPDFVAAQAFEALESGASEVAVGELTQQIKRGLSSEPGIYIEFAR